MLVRVENHKTDRLMHRIVKKTGVAYANIGVLGFSYKTRLRMHPSCCARASCNHLFCAQLRRRHRDRVVRRGIGMTIESE